MEDDGHEVRRQPETCVRCGSLSATFCREGRCWECEDSILLNAALCRIAESQERIADALETLVDGRWVVRPGVRGMLSVMRDRIREGAVQVPEP